MKLFSNKSSIDKILELNNKICSYYIKLGNNDYKKYSHLLDDFNMNLREKYINYGYDEENKIQRGWSKEYFNFINFSPNKLDQIYNDLLRFIIKYKIPL